MQFSHTNFNHRLVELASVSTVTMFNSRFIGKVLLCIIFLMSAYSKYDNFEGTVAYTDSAFKRVGLDISKYGFPNEALTYIVGLAALLEVSGATALLTGGENCGSVMLLLFMIPCTFIMHWPMTDDVLDINHLIHLQKNLAIIGGLIVLRSSMASRSVKSKTQ